MGRAADVGSNRMSIRSVPVGKRTEEDEAAHYDMAVVDVVVVVDKRRY